MKTLKYTNWSKLDKIFFWGATLFNVLVGLPLALLFRTDNNYWVDFYMFIGEIPIYYILTAISFKVKRKE